MNYPKKPTISRFAMVAVVMWFGAGCSTSNASAENEAYAVELLAVGAEPWATWHEGMYYYTQGCGNHIEIWKTDDLTQLSSAESKRVWSPDDPRFRYHLWGPEIHHIDGKWYVYYAADDGNMDNHKICVIENPAKDPFEGEFRFKGAVKTDPHDNWAIHASVFVHRDELYMIWSGWQSPRINTEKQCIYIARMTDPWTLGSERVLLSQPDREWERQWVNPDGSKTAYPIYVNEAPQFLASPDGKRVFILYSCSGSWTPYYCEGMLAADADSDLLDPSVWSKSETPVFAANDDAGVYSTGNFSFVPSKDGKEQWMIYHARDVSNERVGALDSRSPRMQILRWDPEGFPVLGKALSKQPAIQNMGF